MRYLLAILLILFGLWLLTGVTQVQSNERAVVRRFGRVLPDQPGPGLHLSFPWGIDRVDRVPIKLVRSIKIGYEPQADESFFLTPPGQLLTGDHNLVNFQVVLDYEVDDQHIVDFVINGERAEGLIIRAAETALAEWAAGRKVEEVLGQDKGRLPTRLVERTQEILEPYQLGIIVVSANMKPPFPPSEVKPAFDEVAARQTKIATRVYEAQQDRNRRVQSALAEKNNLENEVKSYAVQQKLQAEADATTFLARLGQYQKLSKSNPNYLTALWWDEMSKLYGRMRETGRIDLLDNRLSADGLDITQFPQMPKKK